MPHTLLLADDSVTIRRVIELTFADESVRVVSVSSGREAIASIEAAPPDIILADAGMPDVSGYDIAAFVKGRPNLRHIPVILLAGAFEPLDEARSRKSGSDGVLVKPFEPQMVVTRVRELLSKPAGGPRPVAPATINDIVDPTAIPAYGNSHRPPPLDSSPEASAALPVDPTFDASLDRLDAAFSHAESQVPSLDATSATDFANDLRTLRSTTDSGGFERQDFGDWDLPARGQTEPAPAARFDSMTAHEPEVAAEIFAAPEPEPVVAPMPAPIAMAPKAPAPAPPPPAPTPAPAPFAQPSFAHAVPYQAPPAFAPARPGTPAPALADAFSNLLAAEEGRPYQPLRGAVAEVLPPNAQMTDADMDVIVDKVIARLGSGVRVAA